MTIPGQARTKRLSSKWCDRRRRRHDTPVIFDPGDARLSDRFRTRIRVHCAACPTRTNRHPDGRLDSYIAGAAPDLAVHLQVSGPLLMLWGGPPKVSATPRTWLDISQQPEAFRRIAIVVGWPGWMLPRDHASSEAFIVGSRLTPES
jgi:hypothetical protein